MTGEQLIEILRVWPACTSDLQFIVQNPGSAVGRCSAFFLHSPTFFDVITEVELCSEVPTYPRQENRSCSFAVRCSRFYKAHANNAAWVMTTSINKRACSAAVKILPMAGILSLKPFIANGSKLHPIAAFNSEQDHAGRFNAQSFGPLVARKTRRVESAGLKSVL
jgi:hypothetical protein